MTELQEQTRIEARELQQRLLEQHRQSLQVPQVPQERPQPQQVPVQPKKKRSRRNAPVPGRSPYNLRVRGAQSEG